MRQSYLKNAALLTVSDVVLRLAGMGLRIYLANALGGEGMGLYQLVLAVYSLFVTLATSGVSVASTRLMAEEMTGSPARARGMLLRLCAAALGLGTPGHGSPVGIGRCGGSVVAGRPAGRPGSAGCGLWHALYGGVGGNPRLFCGAAAGGPPMWPARWRSKSFGLASWSPLWN